MNRPVTCFCMGSSAAAAEHATKNVYFALLLNSRLRGEGNRTGIGAVATLPVQRLLPACRGAFVALLTAGALVEAKE